MPNGLAMGAVVHPILVRMLCEPLACNGAGMEGEKWDVRHRRVAAARFASLLGAMQDAGSVLTLHHNR